MGIPTDLVGSQLSHPYLPEPALPVVPGGPGWEAKLTVPLPATFQHPTCLTLWEEEGDVRKATTSVTTSGREGDIREGRKAGDLGLRAASSACNLTYIGARMRAFKTWPAWRIAHASRMRCCIAARLMRCRGCGKYHASAAVAGSGRGSVQHKTSGNDKRRQHGRCYRGPDGRLVSRAWKPMVTDTVGTLGLFATTYRHNIVW